MSDYEVGDLHGVMLTPDGDGDVVYIPYQDLALTVPVSQQIFTPPTRTSEIVAQSKRHRHRGTISGWLIDSEEDGSDGTTITAKQWAQRLYSLYANQGDYVLAFSSPDFVADSIKLLDGYSITPNRWGGFFVVSVPFIEID